MPAAARSPSHATTGFVNQATVSSGTRSRSCLLLVALGQAAVAGAAEHPQVPRVGKSRRPPRRLVELEVGERPVLPELPIEPCGHRRPFERPRSLRGIAEPESELRFEGGSVELDLALRLPTANRAAAHAGVLGRPAKLGELEEAGDQLRRELAGRRHSKQSGRIWPLSRCDLALFLAGGVPVRPITSEGITPRPGRESVRTLDFSLTVGQRLRDGTSMTIERSLVVGTGGPYS
jgi:hypothetical protein